MAANLSKDLVKAADSVRKLKGLTDAVAALGAFVENTASLDQAATEARQRLQQAKDEEGAQQKRLTKLADAIALAEADIKRCQAKAVEVEQAAQRGAATIAYKAKADADRIITEAQAEAERIKGPLNAELRNLRGKIDEAKADLDRVHGATAAAKDTLDALNAQIADARAAIATLLKV